jgi:hypothetical protein
MARGEAMFREVEYMGVKFVVDESVLEAHRRVAALEAALRAVVADDLNAWGLHWTESYYACNWCQAQGVAPDEDPREADHKADCPWAAARRLVAGGEG